MNDTSIPRRKPGYSLELLDGELLLYHLSETKILYLNQTASLVWALCDGSRSLAEIVTVLSQAYPESAAGIGEDVRAVLSELVECGCIDLL
jgi:coenzyme PQQ biosynthesis protein PqqD